nr:homeobox protein unc-4 homolog [Lytechinus pictus]
MLLEDYITSNSTTASIADQVQQHFLPNSYGSVPLPPTDNTMELLGPPPVTRLVPDNLAAAARLPANSASRVEAIKNLLCSESDSEFSALSGDNSNLAKQNPSLPPSASGGPLLFPAQLQASLSAIPPPIPRMSSYAAPTSIGDYRTPRHPYHIPLTIKIPNKIRLPPQKDGKRINQHTYKPHAPGDGLLKIDRKPNTTAASIPGVPVALVMTDRSYQSTIMTDHGILNIISSNEPGSKVPTPPPSYLSVNSNSTGSSSCSLAPSLASTSSLEDQAQAAMAMSSLTHSMTTSNGTIPKRSRSRGGVGKKRTSFTRNQICAMEQRFDQQRYLTSVERKEFSNSIGLDDHHVKIWFQNRRSKLKKQAVVSSSDATARSLVNIRAKQLPGQNIQPSKTITYHVTKSENTSSYASSCQLTKPAPGVHPSHPTPATVYHPTMNGSIPAGMAPPKSGSGMLYATMNPVISSNTNSYSSSTIPAGVNVFGAGVQGVSAVGAPPFAHPYAPQQPDSKATTMMSSASQGNVPTMTTQMSATHGITANGVPFQPPYGYVYDYGADQGNSFVTQSSRSSSPFENFPFSPAGFHCHPDDVSVNPFNQMAIVPPVNIM